MSIGLIKVWLVGIFLHTKSIFKHLRFFLMDVVFFLKTLCHKLYGRLASVGIVGKARESRVGKLCWLEHFDAGFEIGCLHL